MESSYLGTANHFFFGKTDLVRTSSILKGYLEEAGIQRQETSYAISTAIIWN